MQIVKCKHGSRGLSDALKTLPESQAGVGRHKCATCAYHAGAVHQRDDPGSYTEEIESCMHGNTAPQWIIASLPPSQAGPGRHKCVVCAYHAGLSSPREMVSDETSSFEYPEPNLRYPTLEYFGGFDLAQSECPKIDRTSGPVLRDEKVVTTRRKANFAETQYKHQMLGYAGECLIVKHEKKHLKRIGKQGLADKVLHISVIQGDGAGYDVASFFDDSRKKCIEVKTTMANRTKSFYLSANEYRFITRNAEKCRIYRVYNFDPNKRTAEFFELDLDYLHRLILEPLDYLVKFKS